MCHKNKTMVIIIFFSIFFSKFSSYSYANDNDWLNKEKFNKVKSFILTSYIRDIILQPDLVVETLDIKPGMNILDIGAGTGIFTFRFAKVLKNTGRVFATEINPEMIEYLKGKIEETQYKNILPVLVQSQGVDTFYKQHTFDVIFVCELPPCIWNFKSYFSELRLSLTRETGRLYIIDFRKLFNFHEIDFGNYKEIISIFADNGDDYPLSKRLGKDVQTFIKSWDGNDVPFEIRRKITLDFNKMLSDRYLVTDFIDYYVTKGHIGMDGEWARPLIENVKLSEIELAKWLYINLDNSGVFEKKRKRLTNTEEEQLQKLNKMLLSKIFNLNKISFFKGNEVLTLTPIQIDKTSVVSNMEAAGYKLVKEYDLLPQYYFLEFKRDI